MTEAAPSRCSGFTLLEILVAFTIATTALGLLFRIHANSTATIVLSEQYQEASALAQTLIAEHAVTERSLTFAKSGSTDRFKWAVRAAAFASGTAGAAEQRPPYQLRSIEAEVSWPGRDREHRIDVRTVKPFIESLL